MGGFLLIRFFPPKKVGEGKGTPKKLRIIVFSLDFFLVRDTLIKDIIR